MHNKTGEHHLPHTLTQAVQLHKINGSALHEHVSEIETGLLYTCSWNVLQYANSNVSNQGPTGSPTATHEAHTHAHTYTQKKNITRRSKCRTLQGDYHMTTAVIKINCTSDKTSSGNVLKMN